MTNDLPTLPQLTGPSRAHLMPVHPRLLFLYWHLDEPMRVRLSHVQGSAQLRVQISDGTSLYHDVLTVDFDFRVSNWYLPNTYTDCMLRVKLGVVEAKQFVELLSTNAIRIPREIPGTEEETWMKMSELRERAFRASKLYPRRIQGPSMLNDTLSAYSGSLARIPFEAGRRPYLRKTMAISEHAQGFLGVVLHTHLPFVRHPEHCFFLEERWLFEAMTETYLPLLDSFERLKKDQVPFCLTMSLSPTLLAMLRDSVLMRKYEQYLDQLCELAGKEVARTASDSRFRDVTRFYQERLEHFRSKFRTVYHSDLVGAFARLEDEGVLEIITCAATHGFLPLLAVEPEAIWAQIAVAVSEHEHHLGRKPRGLWLPECAYFEGLDRNLAEAGIEFFFVDSHAIKHASSPPRLGIHAPLFCPSGVAAFCRDEECSTQVWSAELGYPGDPSYRDFYRDIGFDLEENYVRPYLDPFGNRGMTGLKYYRITGRTDHKEPYNREGALNTAKMHAEDFIQNRLRQISWLNTQIDRPPFLVAMYDAELFGHWWFEGPNWLEHVFRKAAQCNLQAITPAHYLERYPICQVAEPAASSWGEKGYYEVWLNGSNDWVYAPMHDATRRMKALVSRFSHCTPFERRLLNQAGRELLLAQASDWPFIMRTGTSPGYATRRVRDHLCRFHQLACQLENGHHNETELVWMENTDNIFPNLNSEFWRGV